jgi:hypothetical protein
MILDEEQFKTNMFWKDVSSADNESYVPLSTPYQYLCIFYLFC